jgi:hypothetical protein
MFIISDALQLGCLPFEVPRIPFLQSEYPCCLAPLGSIKDERQLRNDLLKKETPIAIT